MGGTAQEGTGTRVAVRLAGCVFRGSCHWPKAANAGCEGQSPHGTGKHARTGWAQFLRPVAAAKREGARPSVRPSHPGGQGKRRVVWTCPWGCHCERIEAISDAGNRDCFVAALLAMTFVRSDQRLCPRPAREPNPSLHPAGEVLQWNGRLRMNEPRLIPRHAGFRKRRYRLEESDMRRCDPTSSPRENSSRRVLESRLKLNVRADPAKRPAKRRSSS